MTNSKSKPQEHMIAVDARKLSMGLKTTFEGVAMVFDSLGVDAGIDIPEKKRAKAKKEKSAENEAREEFQDETENAAAGTSGSADTSSSADTDDISLSDASDEVADEKDVGGTADYEDTEKTEEKHNVEKTGKDAQPAETVPLSLDDVTKIIVRKIKQDRGNNVKIGQILKTYGAAKVGELDASKYEAFLTDIAEL